MKLYLIITLERSGCSVNHDNITANLCTISPAGIKQPDSSKVILICSRRKTEEALMFHVIVQLIITALT